MCDEQTKTWGDKIPQLDGEEIDLPFRQIDEFSASKRKRKKELLVRPGVSFGVTPQTIEDFHDLSVVGDALQEGTLHQASVYAVRGLDWSRPGSVVQSGTWHQQSLVLARGRRFPNSLATWRNHSPKVRAIWPFYALICTMFMGYNRNDLNLKVMCECSISQIIIRSSF